jgi:hypothetical protein
MSRVRGSPKTGGRVAGTPNKVNKTVRQMILGALDAAGGQEYLTRQAEKNPTAFMTLLGKVLPTQLAGTPEQPIVLPPEQYRAWARQQIREAFDMPPLTIEHKAEEAVDAAGDVEAVEGDVDAAAVPAGKVVPLIKNRP